MVLIFLSAVVLLLFGVLHKRRHERHLQAIPIRIHVNGTRGKSSVTRLIAAGLRAAGLRVMAKTTGTTARLIHPDGTETPFRRERFGGLPNIREQGRLVRLAARERVDVLVTECMAVHPEIQRVAEDFFVRATVGVMTNVRQDHSDVMGDSPEAVAAVLALTVPRGGVLVLGPDMTEAALFRQRAAQRGTRVEQASVAKLSPEELALFPPAAFADNVATALTVCVEVGHGAFPREALLRGMSAALPDPGALCIVRRELDGRGFWLVDAFAANDAASTLAVWNRWRAMPTLCALPVMGVFCNRGDRGFRLDALARDFAAAVSGLNGLTGVLVLGDGLLSARRSFVQSGIDLVRIPSVFGDPSVPEVLRCAGSCCPVEGDMVLFGFGNTRGMGTAIRHWFDGAQA